MKPFTTKQWKKAQVIEKCSPRAYKVRTEDGSIYRRNRRDIIKTTERFNLRYDGLDFQSTQNDDDSIVNDGMTNGDSTDLPSSNIPPPQPPAPPSLRRGSRIRTRP